MKKDIAIGEIVAHDYRAAAVFKEAGIDFCCGGKKSIDETCSEKVLIRVSSWKNLKSLIQYQIRQLITS